MLKKERQKNCFCSDFVYFIFFFIVNHVERVICRLLWTIMFYWVVSSQWTIFCCLFAGTSWENIVNMHIIGAIISLFECLVAIKVALPPAEHMHWQTEIYSRKLLPINKVIWANWKIYPSAKCVHFQVKCRRPTTCSFDRTKKISQFWLPEQHDHIRTLVYKWAFFLIRVLFASKCSFQQSCSNRQRKKGSQHCNSYL